MNVVFDASRPDQPQGALCILKRCPWTFPPALRWQPVGQHEGSDAAIVQPKRCRMRLAFHLDPLVATARRHQHGRAIGLGRPEDLDGWRGDIADGALGAGLDRPFRTAPARGSCWPERDDRIGRACLPRCREQQGRAAGHKQCSAIDHDGNFPLEWRSDRCGKVRAKLRQNSLKVPFASHPAT